MKHGQDIADYRLRRSLPYLFNRVGVRFGEVFETETRKLGLTVAMYRVLAVLAEQDEQSLGTLAEAVSTEISTLSRMIGTLVRKGMVARTRREDDARAVSIRLTEKGRAAALSLIPRAVRVEQCVERSVGTAALAKLRDQLDAIYRDLDDLKREFGMPL